MTGARPAASHGAAISQTQRFGRKQELILDAAARLFHLHGPDSVTLSEVGAAVGLATNSVTYYFRRKEDLIAACFARGFAAIDALIETAGKAPDPPGRVRAFLRGYFALLAEIDDGRRSDIVNFSNLPSVRGMAARPVGEAYTTLFRRVRSLLQAESTGAAAGDMLNSRAHLLLALTQWGRIWLTRYETSCYDRVAGHVADILLYGLAPAARDAPAAPEKRRLASSPPATHATSADGSVLSRDMFLRAATRLINAHGVHGASVERIAASLNATKGAFYHHNTDKREMIAACFERSFSIMRDVLRAAEQAPDGRSRVAHAASALVRLQLSHSGPLLRITARAALPETEAAHVLDTMNRLTERLAGYNVAAQMLQAMIQSAASAPRWARGLVPQNAPALLVAPLIYGFFPRDRPAPPAGGTDEALTANPG